MVCQTFFPHVLRWPTRSPLCVNRMAGLIADRGSFLRRCRGSRPAACRSPRTSPRRHASQAQSVQYCSLLKHRRLSCVPAGCHPRAPSGGGGGPRRRAGGDCKIIYSQTRYGFFGFAAGTPGPAHGLIADRGCFFKRGGRRRRRGWTRRAGRRRRFTSGYGLSRCGHREKAGPPAAAKEDLLVFSRRSWCETARPSSLRQTLLVITQQPYFSSRQAILL